MNLDHKFNAITIWHLNIGYNEIDFSTLYDVKGLAAIAGLYDLKTLPGKYFKKYFQEEIIIVDYQDSFNELILSGLSVSCRRVASMPARQANAIVSYHDVRKQRQEGF